jgi:DNA-binding NtrC family response regulator
VLNRETIDDTSARRLQGLRVLVAEDNGLIGEFMRQILVDLGCVVVGPFATLEDVLRAIPANDLDVALLDLRLGEADILPAAIELAERDIPFIIATGRGNVADLPALLASAPILAKPFDVPQLEGLLNSTFRNRTG